jgi:Glutathione synthase/Ribosomal protein S6 modification enzyme (glutaminyl transferase)
MKLAFILDPLDQLKTAKDSSLAIMHEAINRGHQVFVSLQHDLFLRHGQAKLVSKPWAWNGHTAVVGESQESLPTAFDAIIMRKDPPFDNEYLYSTYLLEIAANQGAKVYNSPSAMRDWNEKLSVTRFIDLAPASLVTANNGLLREFLQEQQDIVVKPLDGMGGSSVFRLKPRTPI